MTRALSVGVLLLLGACSAGSNPQTEKKVEGEAAAAAPANEDCVVGTWSMTEDGFTKKFTFNADKTGEEVYSATETRPLTWSVKEAGKVHIVYTPHDNVAESQWDLGVNCAAKELSFFGAKFTR